MLHGKCLRECLTKKNPILLRQHTLAGELIRHDHQKRMYDGVRSLLVCLWHTFRTIGLDEEELQRKSKVPVSTASVSMNNQCRNGRTIASMLNQAGSTISDDRSWQRWAAWLPAKTTLSVANVWIALLYMQLQLLSYRSQNSTSPPAQTIYLSAALTSPSKKLKVF